MLPILTTMSAGQGVKSLTEALSAQFMTVFDVDCDGRLNLIEFTALNRFFFLVACLDEEEGNREDVSVGTGQTIDGDPAQDNGDANTNAAVFSVHEEAERTNDPSNTSSRTTLFPTTSHNENHRYNPTTAKKVPMSAEEAQMAIAAAAAHLAVEAPPASVLESLDAVLSTAYR